MEDLPEEKTTELGPLWGLHTLQLLIIDHQKGHFHPLRWEALGAERSQPPIWTHELPNSLVKPSSFSRNNAALPGRQGGNPRQGSFGGGAGDLHSSCLWVLFQTSSQAQRNASWVSDQSQAYGRG